MKFKDYYDVMGVGRDASAGIMRVQRELDVNRADAALALELLEQIERSKRAAGA